MITELLMAPIFTLIDFTIGLLPTIQMPRGIFSGIGDAINLIYKASYYLPVGTIFMCIGIIFAFDSFNSIIWLINFIIKKIPTI